MQCQTFPTIHITITPYIRPLPATIYFPQDLISNRVLYITERFSANALPLLPTAPRNISSGPRLAQHPASGRRALEGERAPPQ